MTEGVIEFGDDNLRVTMPAGAFGASSLDDELDTRLRDLAEKATRSEDEWAEKYGTAVDNAVFQMRPYCWCEGDTCRWCSEDACGCLYPAPEAYLDGERVASWSDANMSIIGESPKGPWSAKTPDQQTEWDRRIAERDRRLKVVWGARTHSCEPVGMMTDRERGDTWRPPQTAPNFWHKPSGFKVWWYKYIGRDVEVWNMPTDLAPVFKGCLDSLG